MKTFIIATMHGDELFGLKVVGKIRHARAKNILIRVGHPEAIAEGKRYIQQDLNRSFHSEKKSLEGNIADDIEDEIRKSNSDFIIDIHTSISDVGKIAIVAKPSALNKQIAAQLGVDAIVVMPRYGNKSLIGCFPENSLSLELGPTESSDKLATDIATRIETLTRSRKSPAKQLPVFEVYDEINKNFEGLMDIKNMVFNKDLGGYPFLAGIDTYENFGGFLTRKIN